MNPTLIGSIAVLIWGAGLPIARIIQGQIGVCAYVGISFGIAGLLALWDVNRTSSVDWKAFHQPALYGRWLFFVLHESLLLTAVGIVRAENLPFVILLNYLWPTAIILCSIVIAGVRVTRPVYFGIGTLLVLFSLGFEIIGQKMFRDDFLASSTDLLAYALATCGALSWGLYCAISKRFGDRTGGGSVVPVFQLTLGMALPLSFLPQLHIPWNISAGVGLLAVVNGFAQFIAYRSWDLGMRKGNVVALSLFADFIPWMSLLAAALIVDVAISVHTMISAFTMVVGAMVTRLGTR